MLKFNASAFYNLTSTLHRLEASIRQWRDDKRQEDIEPAFRGLYLDDLAKLKAELHVLGLPITTMSVDRVVWALGQSVLHVPYKRLADGIAEIGSRLEDELTQIKTFVLEPSRAPYFDSAGPVFGPDVDAKFPSAAFEIDEAAKCYALSRPTAAVFHLMRTMEIGIRASARSLGIPDPTRAGDRNWGSILREMKKDMEARAGTAPAKTWPDTDAKEFFESAYTSLDAVRVAWRNTTMHVENKYTDDEADHILVAVKGFMKKLASRIDEVGEPKV